MLNVREKKVPFNRIQARDIFLILLGGKYTGCIHDSK